MFQEQLKSNIELAIDLSIGHRKFFLQIPKNASITDQIDNFLVMNSINIKYQGIILQKVREELQKKQKQTKTLKEEE